MTNRAEIEREMEEKLAEGESAFKKLKAKLDEGGKEVSDETREAVEAAGRVLEKGKAKLSRMAEASDDEFDKLWAETKDEWHDLKADMSSGWTKFSHAVKDLLS
jgi:ElaB/YqjD/DUF883 family membrane-anchored ribosome-binding protein